jgi:hypothetical protein
MLVWSGSQVGPGQRLYAMAPALPVLTADIDTATNKMSASEVPELIPDGSDAFDSLGRAFPEPAVGATNSVFANYLVCSGYGRDFPNIEDLPFAGPA